MKFLGTTLQIFIIIVLIIKLLLYLKSQRAKKLYISYQNTAAHCADLNNEKQ